MRIVSGKYRGRKLMPPANLPVRPTTDYAKESLFNILVNWVDYENLEVLDLFSGTGSIAFEFASRGARSVMAVDANPRCIEFIRKSATEFGMTEIEAVRTNAFVFLKHMKAKYDLIFADPPYDLKDLEKIPDLVLESGLLKPEGLLILEHPASYDWSKHVAFSRHRNYGKVNFTFFEQPNG